MTARTNDEPLCPACGGSSWVIDTQAEAETRVFHPNPGGMPYLTTERRPCTVAFCSTCEFCHELLHPHTR